MACDSYRALEGAPPAVWDPVVRLTHWVIAAVVVGNHFLTKGGSLAHVWLGWIGMAFLLMRLLWAFIGPFEARFLSFPAKPRAALRHLAELARGRPREYRSHNPAGAVMVYLLWGALAAVILTGLALTSGATPFEVARQKAAVAKGDWAALVADEGGAGAGDAGESRKFVENCHEQATNLLLLFSLIHLGGVVAESAALRRNLVRPMIWAKTRDRET
jgi:cytochrome b